MKDRIKEYRINSKIIYIFSKYLHVKNYVYRYMMNLKFGFFKDSLEKFRDQDCKD